MLRTEPRELVERFLIEILRFPAIVVLGKESESIRSDLGAPIEDRRHASARGDVRSDEIGVVLKSESIQQFKSLKVEGRRSKVELSLLHSSPFFSPA